MSWLAPPLGASAVRCSTFLMPRLWAQVPTVRKVAVSFEIDPLDRHQSFPITGKRLVNNICYVLPNSPQPRGAHNSAA